MIETESALKAVEDILSVDDLGFTFVGPGDFSVQLYRLGETRRPEVQIAIETIESVSREVEILFGGIASDLTVATEKIEKGYQIVCISDEFESVRSTLHRRIEEINVNHDQRFDS